MTTDPPEGDDWFTLGSLEVRSHLLTGPGTDLPAAATAATGSTELRWEPQGRPITLPQTGWREVHRTPRRVIDTDPPQTYPARITLAALTHDDHTEWVLVDVAEPHGDHDDPRWMAAVHPRPVRRRPSLETRREGVQLILSEEPLLIVAGSLPDLVTTLQNTETTTWHADPDDDGWVIATLTDEAGQPASKYGWFGLGLAPALPDLPPRGSVNLAAWILQTIVREAPPGRYGLVASLASLGLRSNVRPVEILPGPRPTTRPPTR